MMCEGKRSRYGGRYVRIGPVLLLLLVLASLPATGARSEPAVSPSWDVASGTKGAVYAHTWAIETVDPSIGVGWYASLRLFPSRSSCPSEARVVFTPQWHIEAPLS